MVKRIFENEEENTAQDQVPTAFGLNTCRSSYPVSCACFVCLPPMPIDNKGKQPILTPLRYTSGCNSVDRLDQYLFHQRP